ncbi:hypothetical protein [Blautia faecicola]|uniref:hypothetical protein n=1 Tax=Blautia faecicola TaxID=2509240 RepID=UPI0013E92FCA|nr:hypothetical protein [Blautia faecicola]
MKTETASKIQMEGRQSTIYGCYVENTPEQEDPGEDREDDSNSSGSVRRDS